MKKLIDTNATISAGGRASQWWGNERVKPRAAVMVGGASADIDLQKILAQYKLKGFEFGNWLTINDRYDRVMATEASLRDLSIVLGYKNIGIDGQIGVAFGARGMNAALAHYEPAANMINLTKEKGFGSLAHEYAHAIDYNFGSFIDQHKRYAALSGGASTAKTLPDNIGAQFRWYVNKIVDAVIRSESHARLQKNNEYWHRRTEIWARFFEQYICYKLAQKKTNNTFLCKRWGTYILDKAYLTEKDFKPLIPLADAFCKEVANFLNGKTSRLITKPYPTIKIAAKREVKKIQTPVKVNKPVEKKSITSNKTSKSATVLNYKTIHNSLLQAINTQATKENKNIRPLLCGVFYDKNGGKQQIVATDAHILLLCNDVIYPSTMQGKVFDKNFNEIKYTNIKYPNWKAVIPTYKTKKTLNLTSETVKAKAKIEQLKAFQKEFGKNCSSIDIFPNGTPQKYKGLIMGGTHSLINVIGKTYIGVDYFYNALKFLSLKKDTTFDLEYCSDVTRPVILRSRNLLCLIMPTLYEK